MSLRETWQSVARADRFVYGAALVLVALSFLPYVKPVADLVREPEPLYHPGHWESFFERDGQTLLLVPAVALVIVWELARLAVSKLTTAPWNLLAVIFAMPVAGPLAILGGWVAAVLLMNAPDHPLTAHGSPLAVGVVVYVGATALFVVAVQELRRRRDPE